MRAQNKKQQRLRLWVNRKKNIITAQKIIDTPQKRLKFDSSLKIVTFTLHHGMDAKIDAKCPFEKFFNATEVSSLMS